MFQDFWEACIELLQHQAATDDRRHKDHQYMAKVLSVADIRKQVIDKLMAECEDPEHAREVMPDIPSDALIALQFVPNNAYAATAQSMYGRLGIGR